MKNSHTPASGPRPPSLSSHLKVFIALLVLLLASVGTAYIPMGPFNLASNIGIAVAKALLVLVFFMRLKTDSPLLRIVASIGFAWVLVLIGLSLTDILTRGIGPVS
ncbi:cytochrome C oxidase subunit IV family protein [Pinirhizobacter sp.]|jgi:cytochrome c oxidase subunit 4|uniref:cytochrome C oxidase subunit IV family protein n=1 Tax=Pinirhizobacter sp. TaxID=2950432 RepID=UPI002F414CFA